MEVKVTILKMGNALGKALWDRIGGRKTILPILCNGGRQQPPVPIENYGTRGSGKER